MPIQCLEDGAEAIGKRCIEPLVCLEARREAAHLERYTNRKVPGCFLYGAFVGKCAGCILGAPVEFYNDAAYNSTDLQHILLTH